MMDNLDLECNFDNLKSLINDKKYIEGICGWLFLTSDSNDQLAQQFGFQTWDSNEVSRANLVIDERERLIKGYQKFIVPEKSVIYREFLPEIIRGWADNPERPAIMLEKAKYLLGNLEKLKPIGNLYFRGDTHPNWFGSYFLYQSICSSLNLEAIPLHYFNQALAGFDGDLFGHMNSTEKEDYLGRVNRSKFTLDTTVELSLADPKAKPIGNDGYSSFSRETEVFINENSSLPRAVIFRDSTSQFMTPWFAEHFSRCVCVWHRGNVIQSVIDQENPDFVFQIMAERFVWTYPNRNALD
jgi:hypothetical protein